MSDIEQHLLQIHGILPEFDIVSQTSLEDFMKTYKSVANTGDDAKELIKISNLLNANEVEIPGYKTNNKSLVQYDENAELNKVAYAIIEFIMKKTTDSKDWAYLINYIVDKLNLEFNDDVDDDVNDNM